MVMGSALRDSCAAIEEGLGKISMSGSLENGIPEITGETSMIG